MKIYDLIIIGAGPAGVIAAKTAVMKGLSILILEKGMDLNHRRDLTNGWFGHALFSMNRLELVDNVLDNHKATKEIFKLIQKISSQHNIHIFNEINKKLCRLPDFVGQKLASYLFDSISTKADISFNSEVNKINKDGETFIVQTSKKEFRSKRCLISTGKNSIEWIDGVCKNFGLKEISNGIKIGVRVEIPTFKINKVVQEQGDVEIKTENAKVEDTRINSFVGEWEESNIISAFGHGMLDKKSKRTNFMVGFESKKEVSEVIRNVQIINILANDRLKKERISDFIEGKSILKHIRDFDKLQKVFEEADKILPFFTSYAIMYVPEIRLRGIFPVDGEMKTSVSNLYGAGECTIKVSNLIGAMASGLIAARTILKN